MAYNIIISSSTDELKIQVNNFLAANPTYEALGNPVFAGVTVGYVQAIGEPQDKNGNSITADTVLISYKGAANANFTTSINNALALANADIQVKRAAGYRIISFSKNTVLKGANFNSDVTILYSK